MSAVRKGIATGFALIVITGTTSELFADHNHNHASAAYQPGSKAPYSRQVDDRRAGPVDDLPAEGDPSTDTEIVGTSADEAAGAAEADDALLKGLLGGK